ncbi:MAG: hypothetical protein HYZ37_14235 [Candidatus Solibacter usitatus]|nr:hypothetical protein [Candidatus Solibacter usitatus]
MRSRRILVVLPLLIAIISGSLHAQRRRKKTDEELTQTHEIPKDPPAAVIADAQRIAFLAAPLSSKGLLSQQIRDGLKAIKGQAHGAPILKVRAFVAGTGDLRRVHAIVSEEFTNWKQPLPAVTSIRIGALPQEGAQVVLEAVTSDKKVVNPHGVAFFSGQQVTSKIPMERVEPLLRESVSRLQLAMRGVKIAPENALRVTCFTTSLTDAGQQRTHLGTVFPRAAITLVQALRGLSAGLVECEAVARTTTAPSSAMTFANPEGLEPSPNYSQVAFVNAPKVILSGSQLAFRAQDADVRLAFDRLKRAVEQSGGSLNHTAFTSYYPLTQSTIDKIRQIRFEFLDKAHPPASTMLLFEGLPSLDASFAVEVVALP